MVVPFPSEIVTFPEQAGLEGKIYKEQPGNELYYLWQHLHYIWPTVLTLKLGRNERLPLKPVLFIGITTFLTVKQHLSNKHQTCRNSSTFSIYVLGVIVFLVNKALQLCKVMRVPTILITPPI
jgi:hypothetical protein